MVQIACVVDVSHWNGEPDFNAVANDGILAVIAKAGQGSTSVDPKFRDYASDIRAAGMLLGAYSFLDGSDGAKQADHLIDIVGDPSVPLFLDAEQNASSQASVATVVIAAQRIRNRLGVWPTIYTGRYGPTGDGKGLPNAILSQCPLWLAAYSKAPVLPPGWTDWSLWQYTDKSTVSGMPKPCDRSYFKGSPDEFKAWWAGLTKQGSPVVPVAPLAVPKENPVELIRQAQRLLGLQPVDGDPGPVTRAAISKWRNEHPGA